MRRPVDKWSSFYKPRTIFFAIVGIILSLTTTVYLFTRPAIFPWSDFSDTGEIGDTIGGITTPIINLLGNVLIFYSFIEQTRANRIQTDKLKDEIDKGMYAIYYDEYKGLYKELDDLRFEKLPEIFSQAELEGLQNENGRQYSNLMGTFFTKYQNNEKQALENVMKFRNKVIYPLFKVYRRTQFFLMDLLSDKSFPIQLKRRLIRKVEIELLGSYLRFCNNEFGGKAEYDFGVFDTQGVFNHSDFFALNSFLLNNKLEDSDVNLLQIHDLAFYKRTP